MLEERIDLNHVTMIFDNELNRIKIECHFKKYSKVIELRAENETSFNIWREYIQFELQFNDPNQNKENANHHVSHVTEYCAALGLIWAQTGLHNKPIHENGC